MKTTECRESWDKSDLLAYIEGELENEDRSLLEEHFETCQTCMNEFQAIAHMVGLLRKYPEVFHPDIADLYEFATQGKDVTGEVRDHVSRCKDCLQEVEMAREIHATPLQAVPYLSLPRRIATEFSNIYGNHSRFWAHINNILNFQIPNRLPVFALSTAAAVCLFVFVLWPQTELPKGPIESEMPAIAPSTGMSSRMEKPALPAAPNNGALKDNASKSTEIITRQPMAAKFELQRENVPNESMRLKQKSEPPLQKTSPKLSYSAGSPQFDRMAAETHPPEESKVRMAADESVEIIVVIKALNIPFDPGSFRLPDIPGIRFNLNHLNDTNFYRPNNVGNLITVNLSGEDNRGIRVIAEIFKDGDVKPLLIQEHIGKLADISMKLDDLIRRGVDTVLRPD